MAKMKPPIVTAKQVPSSGRRAQAAVRRLRRQSFEARRDTALIMLLLDTGARRAEMVGPKLTDVDLDLDVLLVLGKSRRERTLPFGRKAGQALDRYLRAHSDGRSPSQWRRRRAAVNDLWPDPTEPAG